MPSTSAFRHLALCSFAWALVACTSTKPSAKSAETLLVPGDPNAPSQVTPTEALGIAESYAKHSWRPFARNILHGPDKTGVLVNTPDATFNDERQRTGWWLPGEMNQGVPYKWGGFDALADFDQGVAEGHAAGDVSSPAKRIADNSGVSANAAGVDCSGFISRCLKLPTVHDTTQLPSVCTPIALSELRPGDLLNIPRGHVLLCAGWARPDRTWVYYYETGGPPDYWKPGLKEAPLASLVELGYKPLRYRGMAREPGLSGKEVLTRGVRAKSAVVTEPVIGEP
ncbi:MAG: hypothetical protein V4662_12930 [Verrucomicrobiota bacterium]